MDVSQYTVFRGRRYVGLHICTMLLCVQDGKLMERAILDIPPSSAASVPEILVSTLFAGSDTNSERYILKRLSSFWGRIPEF